MAVMAGETRPRVLVERAPARTLEELFSAGFTEAMATQTLQELGALESDSIVRRKIGDTQAAGVGQLRLGRRHPIRTLTG